MQNVVPIITPDDFDFKAYMAETEPQVKVLGADAWREKLKKRIKHGTRATGAKLPWAKTHDHIRFRAGEVTVWQGMNGHGKSQVLGQAAMWFAAQGQRVCIASFEMKPVSTLERMLRQFAMNDSPGDEAVDQLMNWAQGRVWLYDQLGSVTPEMVYAVTRYCATKLGIKHMVVDSLMKCVKGTDDYNGQKDFVDMLTGLARDHKIHIHLVHHAKKQEDESKVPNKYSGSGSHAISDLVDQVLTVWRNKPKEKAVDRLTRRGEPIDDKTAESPDALIVCDKNRHGEWEGNIALWYHPASLQYTSDPRNIPLDVTRVTA